jgi:hypothetical protein
VAKLPGITIASVFQIILSHAGRRTDAPTHRRRTLANGDRRRAAPIIEAVLDELDRWLT